MADDDRRAEIETAMMRASSALNQVVSYFDDAYRLPPAGFPLASVVRPAAEALRAALDRVRDARGDDEARSLARRCGHYSPDVNCPACAADAFDALARRDARGDDEGHEGCERRGGVCDCAGRPCSVDYPDAARWEQTAKAATAALVKAEDALADAWERRSPQGEDHEALRAAAKRVLEADMRGERDLDALNALEDAAGFTQQGQRRPEQPPPDRLGGQPPAEPPEAP